MSSSDNAPPQPSPVANIADGLANLAIQPHNSSPVSQGTLDAPQNRSDARPFVTYSRPQLLFLHKSPLVQPPSGMPALKDWFGTETEQLNSKKDSETPLPTGNARDRRFRREADDGSARQSFRGGAITQPSQMGNFKHQSIRATDRDRDKDAEKEQDRERVKEGQERLRNLSDKYDRDRRALSSMSQLRTKERELAPHLANTSSRVSAQGHQSLSSRASDSRDLQRKKDGETNDDWRRGADQPRTGRDRLENGRRDRDDRERPRSRARDSSRSRRDGSPSRRDKEDRRAERDDGYGHRKDKDDRDRDFDRDSELEDPRRWRDDGRRDERMAARREKETRERERERELRDRRDRAWEGDRSERRWAAGDDRDSRGKKSSGRDKKLGEDGKDRDERKDREREKEPAWMDTYIPTNGGGSIGSHNGELDGIQAFRKEMQQKDKSTSPVLAVSQTQTSPPGRAPESQLDEIQLFRLMMKREEEKKKSDSSSVLSVAHPSAESISTGPHDLEPQAPASLEEVATTLTPTILPSERVSPIEQQTASTAAGITTEILVPIGPSSPQISPTHFNGPESEPTDRLTPQGPRLFSTAFPSETAATPKSAVDASAPVNHPVGGSRLLALGSRNPQNIAAPSVRSIPSQSPVSFVQKNGNSGPNVVGVGVNVGQSPESCHFPPAAEALRPSNGSIPFDEHRDATASTDTSVSESIPRGSLSLVGDRAGCPPDHILASETGLGTNFSNNLTAQSFEPASSGVAAARGSRFAKFFDGKSREGQSTAFAKNVTGASGVLQTAPQKPDISNGQPPHSLEARAMEDIFVMLSNSAQAQRLGVTPDMPTLDVGYGSPSNSLQTLQGNQGHPHMLNSGRMDALYDDRNFVPDGMVPGLRSAPPPRSRQGSAMFSDFPDESVQFNNGQRVAGQMFQGPIPSIHHGNMGRNPISMQTTQFRGAPSPSSLATAQRLPPGLANLGARPPHEPSQFVNTSIGMANGGIHGAVHGNTLQPPFSNFQQPSLGFSGGPQMRAPLPGAHTLGPNTLQGLVHPNNLGSSQAQLLGLSGANGMHGGLRGPGGGFGQQGPQVQPPHIALRQHQQPQQQIPPHMLPLHLQQQSFGGGTANQPAHDLMALLMSGARRD